jgi:hypothetical protein
MAREMMDDLLKEPIETPVELSALATLQKIDLVGVKVESLEEKINTKELNPRTIKPQIDAR